MFLDTRTAIVQDSNVIPGSQKGAAVRQANGPVATLGNEVVRLRKQAGLSQEELSDRLGISRESLSKIERDITARPNHAILEGMERSIGLSVPRAYELMGLTHPAVSDQAGRMLLELAALPTHEERLAAWQELPEAYRNAVLQLMADLFQDTASRLRELGARPSRPDRHEEM